MALAAIDTPFEKVQALDRDLARIARKSGSLRLAVGLGLDALARAGGHTHLAFASIEAYALERCERSATWMRQSRKLALRSQDLPLLRRALISGRLSWSMAFEVARVATAADEAQWLQLSGQCTVSQFRDLVKQLREQRAPSGGDPATEDEPEAHCLLTVTANREDSWLYECARMLHRHIEGGTTNDLVEAIVAEATTSLMELLPRDAADPNDLAPSYEAQNA
jgi:hypothetical protein